MAFTSYGGLILSVTMILLALQYSTANGHEGNIGKKWLKDTKTGKDVSLDAGAFDKYFAFGGRKMLQGLDTKPSHISGKKNQGDNPQDATSSSENVVVKHELAEKDDDAKALLEAADEIANLMRKDYKGANRPKRKPPINNHEPTH